jgi:hypothetical protein
MQRLLQPLLLLQECNHVSLVRTPRALPSRPVYDTLKALRNGTPAARLERVAGDE